MRSNKTFCGVVAVLACGVFTHALAAPPVGPAFSELGHLIKNPYLVGESRFAVTDVDGDGLQDLVYVARIYPIQALFVVGKQNGALRLKQSTFLPGNVQAPCGVCLSPSKVVRVLRAPGGDGIYLLTEGGMLRHFTGWPLSEQGSVPVSSSATAAAIGDVNGDGQPELVTCTNGAVGTLAVHSLATGNLLWSLPSTGGSDLLLTQLDADPALEIVVAATPGKVIDGATQALDWQYPSGFGNSLAAGRFGTSSENRFVAGQGNSFIVFRGAPWSPLWEYAQPTGAIAGADLDGDGVDEILYSNQGVHVIDSSTHLQRSVVPVGGDNAIAVADLDGDGVKDIASAANSPDVSSGGTVFVANSQTSSVTWSDGTQPGNFTLTAMGDLDGDGHAEQIVGTSSILSDDSVDILDAASGDELWRAPYQSDFNAPFHMSPVRFLVGQLDADPQQELVIAGSAPPDGRILILDGITRQVQRQIGAYASGPLQNRRVADAALVNYDGDGTLDIVVASSANGGGAAKLHVLSGATGNSLWETLSMGDGNPAINGVLVGNFDADPQPELVAVLPTGLIAWDIQTQLFDWSLTVPADGALLLPFGASGAELAVFQRKVGPSWEAGPGDISFYDATTRNFLRSMSLPAPLTALTALNGDAALLLATARGKLYLVDGIAKTVLASSEDLGDYLGEVNQLGTWPLGPNSWHVASGSGLAVFRHRLDLGDAIFANGFE